MIKNFIINNSMNMINGLNKYNNVQLDEIKYGLEAIYLLISKFVVVFIVSIILGLWKETLILLLLFNFLRATAFGIHASKSIYCWISSIISFIFIPYICKNYVFPNLFLIIVAVCCIILFALYAPADTIKRPLINAKKRKIYKIITLITSLIYFTAIFIIKNTIVKNLIIFAMILQVILILPITYKLFKLPYNNYKNYK